MVIYLGPKFSHIPLIHKRRSKQRYGDLSVKQYKTDNYLPDAINNYLLRLGWGTEMNFYKK